MWTTAQQPILPNLEALLIICGDIHEQYTDLRRLFVYGGFLSVQLDECKSRYNLTLWKTFTDWLGWRSVGHGTNPSTNAAHWFHGRSDPKKISESGRCQENTVAITYMLSPPRNVITRGGFTE